MTLHVTLIVLALVAPGLLPQPPSGKAQAPAASAVARAHTSVEDGSVCAPCHAELTERPVVHAVVGSCSECHAAPPGGKGKVTLRRGATSDNTAPLCTACHEEIAKRLQLSAVHPPAASGDCVLCHDPHGSPAAALLKAPPSELCVGCHDAVGQALGQPFKHAPAAAGCGACHDPHGSGHPAQMKDAVNTVCLKCHGSAGRRAAAPPSDGVAVGQETAAAASVIVLDPLGRTGHPRAGHPVSGGANPADKEKRPLTCASCHQPHGAATMTLLQFGVGGTMELCLKCHP